MAVFGYEEAAAAAEAEEEDRGGRIWSFGVI